MDNEFSDRRIDRKCRIAGNDWTGNHLSLRFSDYSSYRDT